MFSFVVRTFEEVLTRPNAARACAYGGCFALTHAPLYLISFYHLSFISLPSQDTVLALPTYPAQGHMAHPERGVTAAVFRLDLPY